jgi:hypothetical protein
VLRTPQRQQSWAIPNTEKMRQVSKSDAQLVDGVDPDPRIEGTLGTCQLFVGLARTIYIRCVNGIFGRETTIYTVIYGVYVRFWPTLVICIFHRWLRIGRSLV